MRETRYWRSSVVVSISLLSAVGAASVPEMPADEKTKTGIRIWGCLSQRETGGH